MCKSKVSLVVIQHSREGLQISTERVYTDDPKEPATSHTYPNPTACSIARVNKLHYHTEHMFFGMSPSALTVLVHPPWHKLVGKKFALIPGWGEAEPVHAIAS